MQEETELLVSEMQGRWDEHERVLTIHEQNSRNSAKHLSKWVKKRELLVAMMERNEIVQSRGSGSMPKPVF